VVRELHLYASVYNEGKVRIEELYKENSPVYFRTSSMDNINTSKKYFFTIDWNRNAINIDSKTISFNDSVRLNNNFYQVVVNPLYPRNLKGKNYYVLFNSIESTAGGIISRDLKANPISTQSTVIELKIETPVPEKGVDILSRLFKVYNANAIDDKNETAAKTLAFIDNRLGFVTNQLDSVEKNVQKYKSKNQIIDLSSQGEMFLESVKDLDKRKGEIDIQLDVLNDVNNYVDSKEKNASVVPSLQLLNDPTLGILVNRLYDAEIQLKRSKSIAGEKSDAVLLGEEQVNRLRSDIKENMRNIKMNLSSARGNLISTIGANTSMLRRIPQQERGLIDVTREQAIKNNIFSYLLQKREETALNSASTIADLKVIENASFFGPIKPIPENYYLAGLLIGVLVAVFIILLREQFNRKVLFTNEIEDKTKVPVVGEIIQVTSKSPIVIQEGKRTIIAEQFRSLRTNLSFMALSEDAKTTLITSNISGEGKSFISINLAISHTLTDKKVALLELDLRKPRLSNLLNVSRDPGISNYLVGKIPLEGIIKETKIKNLFVVSAGAIPPNPSELILSNKFKEMIEQLKKTFDYLIIDSAPIGPVSDSLLLKDYADTTIFVVRHNATPKMYLKLIDNLSKQNKFKNMCIVFNGLKRRGIGGNYGYGSYGYGNYGFGYGYGEGGQGYYIKEEKKGFMTKIKNFLRN
ncbi:MAG: polysaccharide biosynthesis tyrosine autokinase, partial [Chitinophagaceae bacterium]